MKRCKVERNSGDLGVIFVTLYNPPYENENILHKLGGFKESEVTITEVTTHGEVE